ncbi:helix-turn-helix domain-containing protein [Streptomyces mobaraensis NBRC 13819 = DSM 40847]|uniref:Helix-turn-helix domain-containing protein n=2 Tax=Streptomyces mobaraensis TaxID=35621 RepID=M3ASI8_STRM1|nr:helix-turn-helix domain-containing protein [Streptomyces mobaraensis NBRC 13819 = DSM 40847]QTT77907.1 helix-turn-helix domain-containing protein [Streptomyces mobaraensis NBRC 13819 = DSM 40847]
MGLRANPSQRQRRLGEELRKLREASGLSATEAGSHAGLGRAHMSHIETGRTAIPEDKLCTLLTLYGCTSDPYREALVEMNRATGRGWWSEFKQSHSVHARDLAEMESTSVSCRSFQWLYVPGLLQTPDYAQGLIEGVEQDTDPTLLQKYVEFRLRRQDAVRSGLLRFHAVIHETALHMRFAPAEVMRDQLIHLAEMAQLPNVTVQLLPFHAALSPAFPGTPFIILQAGVPELSTVCVEHPVTSSFLTQESHLAQYTQAFDRLASTALPPVTLTLERKSYAERDSFGLIQHLLYAL